MDTKSKKQGIALVYDPHNLYQFIWYYCTYGTEYEWTALCLPNGYKGEYMSTYCEKSRIFKKVVRDEEAFLTMSISGRLKVFIRMLLCAVMKKQTSFCKSLIKRYVPYDDFELAVVLTDVGIVSGAFICMGQEKRTVILEDGMGDYASRPKGYIFKHLLNPYDIQGFLVAKMGYANPAHYYSLNTTKYCEKFSSNPDQMLYREYKSINQLFDLQDTDLDLFKKITQKVYHEIEECDFNKAEAIVFTNRLYDFGANVMPYVEKFQDYVNKHYKSIIIKRHPRDETNYKFAPDIQVQEIDNSVPAEVILPYLQNVEILFMFTSSILLYMRAYKYKPSYLYFSGLYENSLAEKTYLKYFTKNEMLSYLKKFNMQDSPIIEI